MRSEHLFLGILKFISWVLFEKVQPSKVLVNFTVHVTHREEEILKQHKEIGISLQMKIETLEQEKENFDGVAR